MTEIPAFAFILCDFHLFHRHTSRYTDIVLKSACRTDLRLGERVRDRIQVEGENEQG